MSGGRDPATRCEGDEVTAPNADDHPGAAGEESSGKVNEGESVNENRNPFPIRKLNFQLKKRVLKLIHSFTFIHLPRPSGSGRPPKCPLLRIPPRS